MLVQPPVEPLPEPLPPPVGLGHMVPFVGSHMVLPPPPVGVGHIVLVIGSQGGGGGGHWPVLFIVVGSHSGAQSHVGQPSASTVYPAGHATVPVIVLVGVLVIPPFVGSIVEQTSAGHTGAHMFVDVHSG
jgi:hypothetical protein